MKITVPSRTRRRTSPPVPGPAKIAMPRDIARERPLGNPSTMTKPMSIMDLKRVTLTKRMMKEAIKPEVSSYVKSRLTLAAEVDANDGADEVDLVLGHARDEEHLNDERDLPYENLVSSQYDS